MDPRKALSNTHSPLLVSAPPQPCPGRNSAATHLLPVRLQFPNPYTRLPSLHAIIYDRIDKRPDARSVDIPSEIRVVLLDPVEALLDSRRFGIGIREIAGAGHLELGDGVFDPEAAIGHFVYEMLGGVSLLRAPPVRSRSTGRSEIERKLTSSFMLRFFLPPGFSSSGVALIPSLLRSSLWTAFIDCRAVRARLDDPPDELESNAS